MSLEDFSKSLRYRLGINTGWRFCQSEPGGGILIAPVGCTEEEWLARHSTNLAQVDEGDSHEEADS